MASPSARRRLCSWFLVASVASLAVGSSDSTGATSASKSGGSCTPIGIYPTQICPVQSTATEGKEASVTVAMYSDLSNCDLTPPAAEPGDNGNYVVKLITIDWGDGKPPTSGVAHTAATSCPGTSISGAYGTPEPITGTHTYDKPGTYPVTVSVTDVRGAGNSYDNCTSATPGDLQHNPISNCILWGSPVHSTVTVASASCPVVTLLPVGSEVAVATIVEMRGSSSGPAPEATVQHGSNGTPQPLEPGDSVYPGDIVKTDANTVLALEFTTGGRAGVTKGSAVEVTSESSLKDVGVNVIRVVKRQLGIWSKVCKRSEPLEIQNAGGVIGSKG